ncbi:MAG: DUF1553 domain-containing protein, partial [Planctomycetia bacterium]|nr:DUF1553 domain-containing protein [Planctomycetia bacterium]
LSAADAAVRQDILPQLERLTGVSASASPAAPAAPSNETVLADYTRGEQSTRLICDAAAWQTVPAGQPVVSLATADTPPAISVEPLGHARSDTVWATSRSTGERDSKPLGEVDRAGRVLRTPKHRITEGVFWHRVRGKLQIFVVVDSHVILQRGPLHGHNLQTVDTKGQWQWIKQDLRRDIKDWPTGHVVHVEYAAIEGEAGVAETVASLEQPQRVDPSWPKAMNAALAADTIDWQSEPAAAVRATAAAYVTDRAAVVADARLASATAPALLDGNGIDQFVLLKGSAARPGAVSPRRFLEAIDGPDQPTWPEHSSGRLELADRVLDPANPLASRVVVNRLWHHLFGRGLVPTTDNFGKLGEPPADPQAQALLDHLAVRFIEEGWGLKKMIRQIVTSNSWQMASTPSVAAAQRDPLNLLLHHYPLRRLEGEAIRDKILAVS